MRKGLAERTIVLIILAVIVLGLTGYLIFTHYRNAQDAALSKECLAARMDYCLLGGSYGDLQESCPPSRINEGKGYSDIMNIPDPTPEEKELSPCERLP